jgi:Domain of unknown function (DUF1841)
MGPDSGGEGRRLPPKLCQADQVSPKSRGRKGKRGRAPSRNTDTGGLPIKLFAELFRGAEELTKVDDPLDAELVASDLVGIWWDQRANGEDVEQLLGEGLIDYATKRADAQALALLRALQVLGTSRQRLKAATAAEELAARGVREPVWAERIGDVSAGECWVFRDVYGDQESLFCTFAYADRPHGISVLVDHNLGGIAKDVYCTLEVDEVIAQSRQGAAQDPMTVFENLPPQRARAILEDAFAATDVTLDPPVGEDFESIRALALSRIRALPAPDDAEEQSDYDDEARAAIAAEFLASAAARDLLDREAAEVCASFIVDFGCDYDGGRPLRVSPAKTEQFLLGWLPEHVRLSPAERDAVPAVITAWVRWAAAKQGLPPEAVTEVVRAAEADAKEFPAVYEDPDSASPVLGFLDDVDLTDHEAANALLKRRLFAMPYVGGRLGDEEFDRLNPADPDERRLLVEMEHPEYHEALQDPGFDGDIDGISPTLHIAAHEIVANQLWDDEPPGVWEAAQRLTQLGHDRHEVLHMLASVAMGQIHAALANGERYDPEAYQAALDELPGPEWSR